MHLWDLNRLSGPFSRLCIIHRYLAAPWMFYALALFTSVPSFQPPLILFPPLLSLPDLATRPSVPDVSFRFPGGPREDGETRETRSDFCCHSLVIAHVRDRAVYYHFPYNENLSVNSAAHVFLIFAYIMEYYVFFSSTCITFLAVNGPPGGLT